MFDLDQAQTLGDILTADVQTVTPDVSVSAALQQMKTLRISALVVMEGDKPLGIVTERDAVVLAYEHQNPDELRVDEIMGKPLLTAVPDMDYRDGYRLISEKGKRHLIVVDAQGRLLGIVTEGDFLEHLGQEFLIRFKEVGAVMTRQAITLPHDADLDDALRLMAHEAISCIIIEDEGKPVGIITERDVVKLEADHADVSGLTVAAVMASPVMTVSENTPLPDAMKVMEKHQLRRLVVVESHGLIAGLVTRHDIVKQLYSRHVEHLMTSLHTVREKLRAAESQLDAERDVRLLNLLIDQSNDPLIACNADTHVIFFANGAASAYFKQAKSELIGSKVTELAEWFALPAKSATQHIFETRHENPDGGWYPVEVCLNRVSTDEGNFIITIIRDVSDRHEVMEQLETSERLFRTLTDTAPVGVFRTDSEGECIYVNPTTECIVGLPFGECLGTRWVNNLHPDDHSLVWGHWQQALEEEREFQADYRFRHDNGHQVWVTARAIPERDTDGNIAGYVGTLTDITKIKEQFNELRRWQDVTLGREDRVMELKKEVNELLRQAGKDTKYESVET